MLSKVKSNFYAKYTTLFEKKPDSWYNYFSSSAWNNMVTTTKSGYYKLYGTVTCTNNWDYELSIWHSGTALISWMAGSYNTKSFEWIFYIESWKTIQWKTAQYSSWTWGGKLAGVAEALYYIPPTSESTPRLRPLSLKLLWNLSNWTLYWIHTDNKFYGGIMVGTGATATTGSITLGNAVGFITVNLNWELVKIPYYNE